MNEVFKKFFTWIIVIAMAVPICIGTTTTFANWACEWIEGWWWFFKIFGISIVILMALIGFWCGFFLSGLIYVILEWLWLTPESEPQRQESEPHTTGQAEQKRQRAEGDAEHQRERETWERQNRRDYEWVRQRAYERGKAAGQREAYEQGKAAGRRESNAEWHQKWQQYNFNTSNFQQGYKNASKTPEEMNLQDLSNLQNCYRFFGCVPQDNAAKLHDIYKKMLRAYHPDKLSINASAEIRNFATAMTQKINVAYQKIKVCRAG